MAAERLSMFFLDECHLLWRDVCGYVWSQTNIRIEVPIVNEREKQTYARRTGLLQSRVFASSL
jgi:hypothetical protein